ncbi:MAG: DUF805 domain-containing protein [Asticcacaulis sp.]|nr:DUF805 domain-containing protein [Asticcacaulis sp.]
MSIVQFLFSFEGRVRRLHFWLFFLVLGVVYGGLFWQFGHWHVDHGARYGGPLGPAAYWGATGFITNPLFDVFAIVAIWMKLAILVKRWHDRNKSGWFVLVVLIPFVGWLWQLIECGFLGGTPGPNRFGPSPKTSPAGAF